MNNEQSLVEKILRTYHLSVPEIKLLPNGMVRKSIAVEIIKTVLDRDSWYPDKEHIKGEGYTLEKTSVGDYVLHETNIERARKYEDDQTHFLKNEESKAIEKYLQMVGRNGFDGVQVDWDN